MVGRSVERLLRVGLTGGIGSGKSTVARLLALMGAAVYDADGGAKALMVSSVDLREGIVALLGREAYSEDGLVLRREYIASRVFGDAELRGRLNALVHPVVERDFVGWAAVQDGLSGLSRPEYVVEEAAVLIESGGWRRMDCVVVVTAPLEVRIGRVMRRDGCSRERAWARVNAQMEDGERMGYADFVLEADENRLLVPQVVELHAALMLR